MRAKRDVGLRIRRRRHELGLSQREVADGLDKVTYAYISRLEAGTRRPSWRALIELGRKLDASALWLATGADGTCPVCGRSPMSHEVDNEHDGGDDER